MSGGIGPLGGAGGPPPAAGGASDGPGSGAARLFDAASAAADAPAPPWASSNWNWAEPRGAGGEPGRGPGRAVGVGGMDVGGRDPVSGTVLEPVWTRRPNA